MGTDQEQLFEIDITKLFSNFEDHLSISNNSRIIFSGKFGVGKTYYLNKFFEFKKNEYEVFHRFPVNYQISYNEDIIQFLKRDILIELLERGEVFNKKNDLDRSFISFLKHQFKSNTNSSLQGIIEGITGYLPFGFDKLGKPLKMLLEVDKKFQEFKEGDRNKITTFLEENNTESDVLSEIIKNKIPHKESKDKKEKTSVLILDDLDRIDPEHLFRILNIFSAHFDLHYEELKNKFGFDKIILVADFQNLKSIFHHKYGVDTDSNGYFDKFFSVEVFPFENKEIVTNFIDQIISRFQVEDVNLEGSFREKGYMRIFLTNILINLLELPGKEKLNLRQLLKPTKFTLKSFKNGQFYKENINGIDQAVPQFMNLGIKALISIFGGLESDLLTALEKINKSSIIKDNEYVHGYKIFSTYLLLKIKPFNKSGETDIKWSDYAIKISNTNGEIMTIEDKDGIQLNSKGLFFDLLVEYIDKKYYL